MKCCGPRALPGSETSFRSGKKVCPAPPLSTVFVKNSCLFSFPRIPSNPFRWCSDRFPSQSGISVRIRLHSRATAVLPHYHPVGGNKTVCGCRKASGLIFDHQETICISDDFSGVTLAYSGNSLASQYYWNSRMGR